MEAAESSEAWEEELKAVHTPETEEYGIASMTYQRRLPFHPERLYRFLASNMEGVLRAKGYAWIAGHEDLAWNIYRAGFQTGAEPAGLWWAAVPEREWPRGKGIRDEIRASFVGPSGDRRQELVIIGQNLDRVAFESGLDACLLAEDETLELVHEDPFASMLRTWEEASV